MKKLTVLVSLLSLVSIMAACSQSAAPTQTAAWPAPKVGKIYVFQDLTDPRTDTIEITSTGQTVAGKSNVVRLRAVSSEGDTSLGFYNLESNDDFTFGDSSYSGLSTDTPRFRWTTFPTGSSQAISDPSVDTMDGPYHDVETGARTFIGTETVTVPAGTFSTVRVRYNWYHSYTMDTANAIGDMTHQTLDYWFVPSLAMFVKATDTEISTGGYSQFNASGTELVKYLPR